MNWLFHTIWKRYDLTTGTFARMAVSLAKADQSFQSKETSPSSSGWNPHGIRRPLSSKAEHKNAPVEQGVEAISGEGKKGAAGMDRGSKVE